jgi:hypothetical protein
MDAIKTTPMTRLQRRTFLAAGCAALCGVPAARAQMPATERWRLLVNEPPLADHSVAMVATRYSRWATYLGARLPRTQVLIDAIGDIPTFMQQALAWQKPALVYGHSVNQLSKLVRDHGWQPVVHNAEPLTASFILHRDAPVSAFSQLPGKRLLMPGPNSAAAALAKAELRRQGVREPFISHARFAESVMAQVQAGVADAGVVTGAVARKWQRGGGRVLGETQPVVNSSVLAAPTMSAAAVEKLADVLLGMNAAQPDVLDEIGVRQWVRADRRDYLALLEYTAE